VKSSIPFRSLAIVGLGGIGASVGVGLKRRGLPLRIGGYDLLPQVSELAQAQGVVDFIYPSLAACADAELIVLATPPHALPQCFQELAPHLKPKTVLTDVASIKAPVLAWAQALLPYPQQFVGGHPIAGTERSGLQAARADLFEGAQWVLTPTAYTDPAAQQQVEWLVRSLGAVPVWIEAEQHDKEFALLSFLPHCLAFSLQSLHHQHPTFLQGGSSWRDATRVAESDPALWAELLLLNRQFTAEHLTALITHLNRLLQLLEAGDKKTLWAFLKPE
jgi:prephenate dehydrogenase